MAAVRPLVGASSDAAHVLAAARLLGPCGFPVNPFDIAALHNERAILRKHRCDLISAADIAGGLFLLPAVLAFRGPRAGELPRE